EVSNSRANFETSIQQMIDLQKDQLGTILPDVFFERFLEESKTGFDSLIVDLIPIYQDTYTKEEVKGLIAFYQTDLGKAMLEKTPLVMQASMQVGAAWGERMALRIMQEIEEEDNKD
ncbi:MAG: DUF2059 domain-containing protein, partial [Bacteroidota bacterium]